MSLKITILTNDADTWMAKQIPDLVKKLETEHTVKVCYRLEEIEEGDILFLLSVYKLVPNDILKRNKHNIVVHASSLPKGKGWSPATWQILEDKNEIPLTLFEAAEKVDSGVVYVKDSILLDGTELSNEWQEKLGRKINEMILRFINEYEMTGEEQIGEESFYPRRTPEDSELDINKNIKEQFNLFRVADNENYPAFFVYKGKKYILKIYKAS